ncbi:MFS transporter [Micromonospora sp. NPDC049204]|uniref:MFS transporter n=1 Tax=Micromonospora sp. NPDC049204 TaxID=3154351 RepID=UPI0033FF3362
MSAGASRVDDAADAGQLTAAAGRTPVAAGTTQAWRVVVGFGVVSLAADMVYEGARSIYGPLLASLGASAVVVGLVTGAGEAAALLLRLVFGPLADRTRRYWTLTIVGYALTAVCVPLLAVTPILGGAGLAVAAVLILAERLGKAIRSPAKSALLADAAGRVGMGRGLGVHKALDQIGAFAGPLLVAAVVAVTAGALWPGLAVLTVPAVVAMLLLTRLRVRARASPEERDTGIGPGVAAKTGRASLPGRFHWFSAAMAVCTAGLVTFGLIGFHLVRAGVVATAAVPLMYAMAMATGGLAALLTGVLYDRVGPWVLVVLPAMIAVVPPLAFGGGLPAAVVGVVVWGAAVGLQDSTVKAMVADLVPRERRATAYGIFAAVQGVGALAGGAAAGLLYDRSVPSLTVAVAVAQAVALLMLLGVLARTRQHRRDPA